MRYIKDFSLSISLFQSFSFLFSTAISVNNLSDKLTALAFMQSLFQPNESLSKIVCFSLQSKTKTQKIEIVVKIKIKKVEVKLFN